MEHAAQGSPQAYQFFGGNWQLLGGQYVYNNTISKPQLAFDAATAYVIFQDDEHAHQASVFYLGMPLAEENARATWGELYPNPVADIVHLRLTPLMRGGCMRICDAQGRIYRQWVAGISSDMEIAVGNLPTGRYWLVLETGRASPKITSFTKN